MAKITSSYTHDIRMATDAQLDAELDAIKDGGGYNLLGELQIEIERRKAQAIKELRDREQIAQHGLGRRIESYVDFAKCSIEADLVKDAKRELDRKQALLDKLAAVSAHLEATVV